MTNKWLSVAMTATCVVTITSMQGIGSAAAASIPGATAPFGMRDMNAPVSLDTGVFTLPGIYATKLSFTQQNDTVTGTFTVLNNEDDAVGPIQYNIEILGTGKDADSLVRRTAVRDAWSMAGKTQKDISFQTDVSGIATGTYTLRIQIVSSDGRYLGWQDQELDISHPGIANVMTTKPSLQISQYESQSFDPLSGPNVDPAGTLTLHTTIENRGTQAVTLTPMLDVYTFDIARGDASTVSYPSITIEAGKTMDLNLPVSASKTAGAYSALLRLTNSQTEQTIGTYTEYRWVVRGASADILPLSLSTVGTTKGSQLTTQLAIVGAPDAVTTQKVHAVIQVVDAMGVAGEATTPVATLTDKVITIRPFVTLTRDLTINPTLKVSIVDEAGHVLRTESMQIPVSISAFSILANPVVEIALFVILAALAAMAFTFTLLHWGSRFAFTGAILTTFAMLLLCIQVGNAFAIGNGNGIVALTPNTAQGCCGWSVDGYAIELFVNAPIHDAPAGTYQKNNVPFQYRVNYAVCNNNITTARVFARYDLNGGKQTTVTGTNANWSGLVHDQLYETTVGMCGGVGYCRTDNTYSGNLDLSGVVPTACSTTLQVAGRQWMLHDGIVSPDFVTDWSSDNGRTEILDLWVNFTCNTDVSIVKTGPANINQGDLIGYMVRVTNNGTAAAQNVVVTDAIPTGLTFSAAQSDHRCTQQGNAIVCTLGTLAQGPNDVAIYFQSSAQIACGPLTNTATLTSSNDTNPANNTSTANTTVNCPTSDVSIVKTGPASINQGDIIGYSLTIKNNGPGSATSVTVNDPIPAGLTFVSAQSDPRCTQQGNAMVCALGTLTSGQSVPVSLYFQSSPQIACGTLTNTATVSTTATDTNSSNNTSTANTTVNCPTPSADVSIQKTGPANINQGDLIGYTLTAHNNGPSSAQNVVVTDAIPSGLTFSPAQTDPRCTQQGSNIICALGTMTNGQTIQLAVYFQSSAQTACAQLTNTATITTTTQDPNGSNNQSSFQTQVQCPASSSSSSSSTTPGCIDIQKIALDPNGNQLGTVPQFTFFVDGVQSGVNDSAGHLHISNVNVGNHTIAEAIPNGWTLQSIVPTNGVITVNSGNSCTTVTFTNKQNPLNSSSSSSSSSQQPQLGCIDIQKEAFDPNGNLLGTVPQFSFYIDGAFSGVNDSSGHLHLNNISVGTHTVSETIPSGWNQFLVTPSSGVVTVSAGNSCAGVVFKNQQIASSSSSSSMSSSSSSTPTADVTITKVANPNSVAVNSNTTFTVTVTNIGASTAQNVNVTDNLPGGLNFANVAVTAGNYTNGIWSIGTLNPGGTATMQLIATVTAAQTYTNYAYVTTTTPETNYNNNSANASVTGTQQNNGNGCIDVYKTAVDSNGNTINYVPSFTFTLDNNTTATNDGSGHAHFDNVSQGSHSVTEYQQSGWTQISMSPSNGNVFVNSGGSCATIYVRNQQSSNPNGNPTLTILKTDGRSIVSPGDQLTYTITVQNTSNVAAQNVTITDTMPPQETPNFASQGGYISGQSITWNNIFVPGNGSQTVTVSATVNPDATGTLTNRAEVQGSVTFDTDTIQNGGGNSESLTLTKSASTSEVFPAGMIEYTVNLRNDGNGPITNLVVTDNLPSDVTVADNGDADNASNSSLTWHLSTLSQGATRTLSYRINLGPSYQAGMSLTNNVTATADNGINQRASVTVSVIGNLPQTGWIDGDVTTGSPFLKPILRTALTNNTTTSSSAASMGSVVAFAGLAAGAIGGLVRRKIFYGI